MESTSVNNNTINGSTSVANGLIPITNGSIDTSSTVTNMSTSSNNCYKFNDNLINPPYKHKHCIASTTTDGTVTGKCYIDLNHTEKFFSKNNLIFYKN